MKAHVIPDGFFDNIRFRRCKVSKNYAINMNGYSYSISKYPQAKGYKAVNAAYLPENPNTIFLFLGSTIHQLDFKENL